MGIRAVHATRLCKIAFLFVLLSLSAWAQERTADTPSVGASASEYSGETFSFKTPEGFKQETSEEAGTTKWKKGSAEIHLAVGDLFAESEESLFGVLHDAATKDERIEGVISKRLEHGRWLLYKEKAPQDGDRIQLWRLVAITQQKVISLDFAAPAKDFGGYVQDFTTVIESFTLKASP